jgi:hypothetical protein
MSTQNITRSASTAGSAIRDIRSAPGYATRAVGIGARGSTLTATSAGWTGGSASMLAAVPEETPERKPGLIDRLHERKLVQWTLAYIGFAWAMLQFSGELAEAWEWPALARQAVSLVLACGVAPALVVAWFHGEKGRQQVCRAECVLVAASVAVSAVALWSFCRGAGL